eukprot:14058090-Alexandrium_andersonii.AAC.1
MAQGRGVVTPAKELLPACPPRAAPLRPGTLNQVCWGANHHRIQELYIQKALKGPPRMGPGTSSEAKGGSNMPFSKDSSIEARQTSSHVPVLSASI